MPWTLCIRVPKDSTTIDGKRIVCFFVPQLVPPRLGGPPDPPFVTHPDLKPEQVRHLQSLATIDQIADGLPAEFSTDIRQSVDGHMKALARHLGAGIELSRHDHKG